MRRQEERVEWGGEVCSGGQATLRRAVLRRALKSKALFPGLRVAILWKKVVAKAAPASPLRQRRAEPVSTDGANDTLAYALFSSWYQRKT